MDDRCYPKRKTIYKVNLLMPLSEFINIYSSLCPLYYSIKTWAHLPLKMRRAGSSCTYLFTKNRGEQKCPRILTWDRENRKSEWLATKDQANLWRDGSVPKTHLLGDGTHTYTKMEFWDNGEIRISASEILLQNSWRVLTNYEAGGWAKYEVGGWGQDLYQT